MYKLYTEDILTWNYDGLFHACLCDPPYHLTSIVKRFGKEGSAPAQFGTDGVYSRHSGGFMGQQWDGGDVAFRPETWKAIGDYLLPGAYLLAFGGTRTWHRLACAIEDAGFEIRDTVMWVYGCLSEDTEILTENGWEHYHKNITTSPALCYNIDNDTFEFHKPTKSYNYANKHTAYRIQSDNTDQIVSRNHRCLVERNGRKVFVYAEELEDQENIPFLESLRDLPETISYLQFGASIKKQDLLSRMQRKENISNQNGQVHGEENWLLDTKELRILQETDRSQDKTNEQEQGLLLQSLVQIKSIYRSLASLLRQWKGEVKVRKRNGGGKESCLERRSNILQNTWELCGRKIRALSERILGYGAQRWLCYGTSPDSGTISREITYEVGMRPSYQSRRNRQPIRESDVIQDQSGTQNIRRTRATVTPIEYAGNVWCVEVPTGAFVARRNGKIFITGNSGFPKSHNVSKAIDREAGQYIPGEVLPSSRNTGASVTGIATTFREKTTTNPQTDMAKTWDGYGSALKPAFEPIIVARKPLEGTIAQNCVQYGSGALNIDGCRVEGEVPSVPMPLGGTGNIYGFKNGTGRNGEMSTPSSLGRWPANLIHDGSDEVMEGFPHSKGTTRQPTGHGILDPNTGWNDNSMIDKTIRGFDDEGSSARFFYCAKASKRERDLGCEEMEESEQDHNRFDKCAKCGGYLLQNPDRPSACKCEEPERIHAKSRNSHPTVKPLALTEYLARLILPPVEYAPRRLLVPFAGSGSEMIGAYQAGWDEIVGVELSPEYAEIAEKRLKYWISIPKQMEFK